jgi:hypothetical protein
MPRKLISISPKKRMEVESTKRKVVLKRQGANQVAGLIFARMRKIPNMKLVEGLPKTRTGIESKLNFLHDLSIHTQKREGFHKYGSEFLGLYDLVAEKMGVTFGKSINPQKANQVYFPTPKIKNLISSLKKRIKADVDLDKLTKTNSLYTLDSLSKQSQIGRIIGTIALDRQLITNSIRSKPKVSSSQTIKMINVLEKTLAGMQSAEALNPVQLANLYIELYGK